MRSSINFKQKGVLYEYTQCFLDFGSNSFNHYTYDNGLVRLLRKTIHKFFDFSIILLLFISRN